MLNLQKALTVAVAVSLAVGGLVLIGPPAASAASGPPQPYHEPSEGVSVPIFGLIAIAGIATIAIWQGVKDAKKKKEAQQEKEQELKEQEEFEEYFDFGSAEPEAPGTADGDGNTGTTATGAE